jgi:hypothetical protein
MSERTKGQLLVENKRLRAKVERLDRIVNPMAVAIVTHAKRKIWYSRPRVNLCPRQGAGDSRSVCTGCRGKTPTEPIYFESRCRSHRGRGGHLAQTTSIQQTLSSTRGKCPRVHRVESRRPPRGSLRERRRTPSCIADTLLRRRDSVRDGQRAFRTPRHRRGTPWRRPRQLSGSPVGGMRSAV